MFDPQLSHAIKKMSHLYRNNVLNHKRKKNDIDIKEKLKSRHFKGGATDTFGQTEVRFHFFLNIIQKLKLKRKTSHELQFN